MLLYFPTKSKIISQKNIFILVKVECILDFIDSFDVRIFIFQVIPHEKLILKIIEKTTNQLYILRIYLIFRCLRY